MGSEDIVFVENDPPMKLINSSFEEIDHPDKPQNAQDVIDGVLSPPLLGSPALNRPASSSMNDLALRPKPESSGRQIPLGKTTEMAPCCHFPLPPAKKEIATSEYLVPSSVEKVDLFHPFLHDLGYPYHCFKGIPGQFQSHRVQASPVGHASIRSS